MTNPHPSRIPSLRNQVFLSLLCLIPLAGCGSGSQSSAATPTHSDVPAARSDAPAMGTDSTGAAPATSMSSTAPDNSARNVVDRGATTATPMDQGESSDDIRITAEVRKGLMADSSLSTDAQNIKVITNDCHVVLRGPVANAAECQKVNQIATNVTGVKKVDNLTEATTK